MVTLGIILLLLGFVAVVVCYIASGPPIASRLGWVAVGLGAILIILGYILPAIPHDYETPGMSHVSHAD